MKIVAHLPVPAGELKLKRISDYGWIETRRDKHHTAVRLTPEGIPKPRRLVELGLKAKSK